MSSLGAASNNVGKFFNKIEKGTGIKSYWFGGLPYFAEKGYRMNQEQEQEMDKTKAIEEENLRELEQRQKDEENILKETEKLGVKRMAQRSRRASSRASLGTISTGDLGGTSEMGL